MVLLGQPCRELFAVVSKSFDFGPQSTSRPPDGQTSQNLVKSQGSATFALRSVRPSAGLHSSSGGAPNDVWGPSEPSKSDRKVSTRECHMWVRFEYYGLRRNHSKTIVLDDPQGSFARDGRTKFPSLFVCPDGTCFEAHPCSRSPREI